MNNKSFNAKYAAMNAAYFAAFASIFAYATNFLANRGFSNGVIGTTLSLTSILGIFVQPAVASFADRRKDIKLQTIITFFVGLAIALSAVLFSLKTGSFITLFLFVGIAVGMGAIGPIMNSLAFAFEKYGIKINYGLARGIGSASYAIVSLGVGYIVDAMGTEVLPIVYSIFNVILIIIARLFTVPEVSDDAKEEENNSEQLSYFAFMAKYKEFMFFIVASVFVFFAHTIINNFYIKVLEPIQGTSAQMGIAIFIAAILELPAMVALDKIKEKISIRKLLIISAVIFALKHAVTCFATNISMIYFAAVLQVGAYAIFYPSMVYYANEVVASKDLVKGQSLIGVSYTACGIVANIIGGSLLDVIGVHNVLMIGVVTSVIGAALVFLSVRKK